MKFIIIICSWILILFGTGLSQNHDSSTFGKNRILNKYKDYEISNILFEGNNNYCDSIPYIIDQNIIDSTIILLENKVENENNPFSPPQILRLIVYPDDKITLVIEDSLKNNILIRNINCIKNYGTITFDANSFHKYFFDIQRGSKFYFIILKNDFEVKKGVLMISDYSFWISI